MNPPAEEVLTPTRNDYLRFLAAVTGTQVSSIDDFPLAAAFLPCATPTWAIAGAGDLPDDGASATALPGVGERTGGVMGLGQEAVFHLPVARYEPLHRTSELASDEIKTGRSGPFRLVMVERRTIAGRGALITQRETYAIRSR